MAHPIHRAASVPAGVPGGLHTAGPLVSAKAAAPVAAARMGKAIARWDNEGGAPGTAPEGAELLSPGLPRFSRAARAPEDTVIGCEARAAANLAEAALASSANARRRLEHSAASWGVRATMIQEQDAGFAARKAALSAEWDEEETPLIRRRKTKDARNIRL
jgi:hypothetical protein